MRVTQRSLQDNWLRDLQTRLGSLDQLNKQIGSGVRVQKPADDPAAASRIVRIAEVVARNEQYLKNIDQAVAVQQASEAALEQVYQQMSRAKSLAVEGSNAASVAVAGSFGALADEIAGIRAGVLQLALSRHEGKYLFAGTADEIAPFGASGGSYQGDSNFLRVNMGNGQTAAVNVSGDRAFRETAVRGAAALPDSLDFSGSPLVFRVGDGLADAADITLSGTFTPDQAVSEINRQLKAAGLNVNAGLAPDGSLSLAIADSMEGGEISIEGVSGDLGGALGIAAGTKNVFGLLDDLEAALRSEDSAAVSRLLGRLDRALDDVVNQRGQLGARGRNLAFARDRLQVNNITSETLRTELEGVDLPQAVTKLSAQEQAYQTSLAAGARIFNVSILDFLR